MSGGLSFGHSEEVVIWAVKCQSWEDLGKKSSRYLWRKSHIEESSVPARLGKREGERRAGEGRSESRGTSGDINRSQLVHLFISLPFPMILFKELIWFQFHLLWGSRTRKLNSQCCRFWKPVVLQTQTWRRHGEGRVCGWIFLVILPFCLLIWKLAWIIVFAARRIAESSKYNANTMGYTLHLSIYGRAAREGANAVICTPKHEGRALRQFHCCG
jgi:hypothetical protein